MAANTRDLIELIKSCVQACSEVRDLPPLTPATEIFGEDGLLDSAGLVVLVTDVEEAIERKYETLVSLADERAMSETRSPFRTIETLAEYARVQMEEAERDG